MKGDIPGHIIYSDESVVAFLDVSPRAPGHTMVISRHHAATLLELPEREVAPLFLGARKVVGMIKQALKPDGFTMGINQGRVSGQTVEHLHFHIIPRWLHDGGTSIHNVVNNPPAEGLEEIAQKIKEAVLAEAQPPQDPARGLF